MSTINSKLGFKFNHKPNFQLNHKLNNKPNHKFNLTIATLLALVLSTVMGTFGGVSALASTGSFVDVGSGTAYQEEITDLAKEGIIHGYGDGNYGPNNSLTRGELAKIIKNTLWGKAYSNLKCADFPDVDTNNTFYLEITTLKCEGIVNGYPDGTFRPNAKVSIGEAIKFTFNNNKYTPASKPLSNYNQSKLFKKNLARDTFGTFIDKAVQNGALDQDYDGGLLDISQYIDRKQMANLIHRARKPNQEKIKKKFEEENIISINKKTGDYDLTFYYDTKTKVIGYKGNLILPSSCPVTTNFKLESVGSLAVMPRAELIIAKTIEEDMMCTTVMTYPKVSGEIYDFVAEINDQTDLEDYIKIEVLL